MRRGALALWMIVTLVGWGFVEVRPKTIQDPQFKQIGTIKSIEKQGWVTKIRLGNALVTAYNFPEHKKPGDKMEVEGYFVDVLSLKSSSYAKYLKSQGIHWTGRARSWTTVDQAQGLYYWRYAAQNRLEEAIDFLYRGDGFLVKALLYGDKRDVDQRIQENFARTGTAHVLALSGFHTGILALILHQLLFFLPPKHRIGLIGAFLLGYCFFTGMKPSIGRATVFFLILYASVWTARRYDVISAAAVTASVFTAYNPYVMYDIGFQLSFLSVVSIGMFLPMLEAWAMGRKRAPKPGGRALQEDAADPLSVKNGQSDSDRKNNREWTKEESCAPKSEAIPGTNKALALHQETCAAIKREQGPEIQSKPQLPGKARGSALLGRYSGRPQNPAPSQAQDQSENETKKWLLSALMVTVAAQVLTVPVVAFYFHQVSLVSVLANIVVLPGMTLLMAGFILSLLTLPLFSPLAKLLAGACRVLMRELLGFVGALSSWRWAGMDTGELPLWAVLSILLLSVLFWRWWESKKMAKNKMTVS